MKKMIIGLGLISLLTGTQAMAEESSELYVGLDYFKSSNTITVDALGQSVEGDNDSGGLRLKFGADLEDNWRVQGYLAREVYDQTLFDDTNDELYELGVEVVKAFAVTPEFLPFVQVGIGYGVMSVEGYNESSISELSLKAGLGVMYKVTPKVEVLAGFDYQYRKWQDIEMYVSGFGNQTLETSEKSTRFYFGANYHF